MADIASPEQPAVDTMLTKALELNATWNAKQPVADAPVADVKKDDGPPRENGQFTKKPETIAKEEAAKNEQWTHAFRRAQIPQELVDLMTPEQKAAIGGQLFESQGKIDKALREKGVKTETRADPLKDGTPQKAADLKVDARVLAEKLALTPDEQKEIEGFTASELKRFEAQHTEVQEALEAAAQDRFELGRELGISAMAASYPEVAQYREQIEAKYEEYAETGAYDEYSLKEGVKLCARDAIEFVCKPAIDARKRADSEAKSKGQPSAGSRQGDGALKSGDPMMAMANHLNAHPGDHVGARRAAYGN